MAPINNPNGNEVSEIVLPNGNTASEVIAPDGSTVFEDIEIPDSEDLRARYDARELSLSDGDSVTAWSDETGNGHDLTTGAAPTFKTNIQNGNPVVRFDGTDDVLSVDFTAQSQPNYIFAVIRFRTVQDGTNNFAWSSTDSNNRQDLFDDNGDNAYSIQTGSTEMNSTTNDTNWHIFSALYNEGSSTFRIDGTQENSGSLPSATLNGFTLGGLFDGTFNGPIDVAEVLIYPDDKSGIESDVESYLSDAWGVPI